MNDTLLCPICRSKLIVTHQDRYESLSEHVSDPNGTPSMKDGYQCSDTKCSSYLVGATWTYDGSVYVNPPKGMGYGKATSLLHERCIDGIDSAINSWQRSYDVVEKKRKKYTININLYWIMIQIEPRYSQDFDETPESMAQSNGMDKKEKYRWKFSGRSWTWFKRGERGSYTSFSPIWQIIRFKNREFKNRYHRALQRNDADVKYLLKMVTNTAYWSDTKKEDRYWYRVANKILRFWYYKEFDLLKNLNG